MIDFDIDKFLHDNYVTISYESQPIGPIKIVLYLTTFDIERYKNDQGFETKTKTLVFEEPGNRLYNTNYYDNTHYYEYLQKFLNNAVMRYYEPYVEELKREIDTYNTMLKTTHSFYNVEDVSKSRLS